MTVDPFANEVLWRPSPDAGSTTRLGGFLTWVEDRIGVSLPDYSTAWQWSVDEPGAFWSAVRDHFALPIVGERIPLDLGDESPTGLPGAHWFPGASLNAAEIMLAADGRSDGDLAIIARSQTRDPMTLTFGELRADVARVRRGLVALGVGVDDRVAAYAPNIPETIIAFLATASLGAIWTSCAPEFGTRSVLDRLTQIRPKVLLTIDGYRYGNRRIDRRDEVATILGGLDSLDGVIHLGYLDPESGGPAGAIRWEDLDGPADPGIRSVPFDHPLYVLYSSGTTGLPKPIIHGHGGITLEHHKALALQSDLGPDDRFFWFTTTGWMMWNYLVSGLAVGSTLVLFDGDPGSPSIDTLWQLADECAVTAFGVSAPFLDACRQARLTPGSNHDLGALRWLGSTGAPLHADGFRWVAEAVGDVPVSSISGGTDVCTAFVGGASLLPVQAGVIPCRFLGADVHAVDGDGREVTGKEGELVVATPMPSMPVGLWGDEDGSRLRSSYFSRYPDKWWHGDWITVAEDGRCVISGRSDATLNRGGVRLGTADFYAVVGDVDGVEDSLVVHLDRDGADELLAFLVLDEGVALDDVLLGRLRTKLRTELSPRHVPDRFVVVPAIPRTLSGKKTEIPVKRILAGDPPDEVLAAGALANPDSIEAYVAWSTAHRRRGHPVR